MNVQDLQKIILPNKFFFIEASINTEVSHLDAKLLKNILVSAVRDMFGQIGVTSYEFDIIEFKEEDRTCIIRVNSLGFVPIWSALTLLSQYNNMNCNIIVKRTASHLITFGTNELHFLW